MAEVKREKVRVLAFTCSRHRPLMLRHCILQMQRQTYALDHAVYVNSDEADGPNHTSLDYRELIDDAGEGGPGRLLLGFGPSRTPHENYLAALRLADLDAYDLFLKIDDDDFYMRRYVETAVADFVATGWDYSGCHSPGQLNGHRWYPNEPMVDLGLPDEDVGTPVLRAMPPTSAFSRRAIEVILALPPPPDFEDIEWRRAMAAAPGLKSAVRPGRTFFYNIHGGNTSTAEWYEEVPQVPAKLSR